MPVRLMLADSERGRDYVIVVAGQLDDGTSRELRRALLNAAPGFDIVLDLSQASPISAEQVAVIAEASGDVTQQGRRLRVIASDETTARQIESAGIGDVVPDRRTRARSDAAA